MIWNVSFLFSLSPWLSFRALPQSIIADFFHVITELMWSGEQFTIGFDDSISDPEHSVGKAYF